VCGRCPFGAGPGGGACTAAHGGRLHGDAVVGEQDAPVRRSRAVRRQQDVRRFHVPVQHTPLVPGGQRVEHGEADPGALRRGERSAGPDQVAVDPAGGFADVDESDPFQFPRRGFHGHHRLAFEARPLLVAVLEPDGNPAGVTLERPQWISLLTAAEQQ
jgi:hypothetical protein